MKSRLVNGAYWTVISRPLAILISVLTSMLLARLLSIDDMGTFFLALSIVSFLTLISQVGQSQVAVKFIAESLAHALYSRCKHTVYKSLTITFLGSLLVGFIFLALTKDIKFVNLINIGKLTSISYLMLIGVVVFSMLALIVEIFRGFHNIKASSLVSGIFSPLIFLLLVSFKFFSNQSSGIDDVYFLYISSSFFVLLVSFIYLGNLLDSLNEDQSKTISFSNLLSDGWPICVIQLTIFVSTQADLWVVSYFLKQSDVAIYGATQKLVIILTLTYNLVISVIQSTVVEIYAKKQYEKLQDLLQISTLIACFPALLLMLGYIFFGDTLLVKIFGAQYADGYLLLVVLAMGQLISMFFGAPDMLLMMTGNQNALMRVVFFTSILRILFAGYLSQKMGVIGIALGWAIFAVIQTAIVWRLALAKTGLRCNLSLLQIKNYEKFKNAVWMR